MYVVPEGADANNYLATSVAIGNVVVTNEVEVKNDAGNPLSVSGTVSLAGTLGAALTAVAPVACTAVAAVALAADATRRKVVFRNVGANAIALGPVGVVFANAAIVLQPTEMWVEKDAPGAAWDAICDAALASTLNIVTAA